MHPTPDTPGDRILDAYGRANERRSIDATRPAGRVALAFAVGAGLAALLILAVGDVAARTADVVLQVEEGRQW